MQFQQQLNNMKNSDKQVILPPHEPQYILSTLSQKQGWGIKQHNIPKTWTITQGEGMKAVVIDTGHPQHDDIGDNAIKGKNFIKDEEIYDKEGHQTHCTGIICAKNNTSGMVGVAPKAKCITAKALGLDGSGSFKSVTKGLLYALDIKADVVSMSLGSATGTSGLHATIKKLYKANIPVVCAAGNSGKRGVDYPARYSETIAVAAYDKNGRIANFSGVGEAVDFSAPGVGVYSTYLNNKYCVMSGTSSATPFITGIILLLLAKHRLQEAETGKNDCKTVNQIREHLRKYTIDKGYVGKDKHWGYGVIDAENLILSKNTEPIIIKPEKFSIFQKIRNILKNIIYFVFYRPLN